ncbi:DNA topoisomerase I [Candidatus Woesearchaeota archaeon CG10_big_fil_rev_8_21_14_0_10_30_7]|nr:MAG: DNA topoisomerase I [Candidatus Woesearchaeota archaeon CG10_big_fil_rev_8_21_14_0_10_30_7]
MSYTLLISEKPAAAKKIAEALADGKPVVKKEGQTVYYLLSHNKQDLVVGCAVGHLFGLEEKEKSKSFNYPVFDIEWKPTYEISKSAAFAKKYFNTLKKIAKKAKEFIVCTDYDVEGEVIGLNIIRYICHRNDAKRMKFSTLLKKDITDAYNNCSKTLDWGQAEAGETRHFLDFYYGINISRALTTAIKKAGSFKILSSGRVQSPALKIIVDREKEIKKFIPKPYWQLELLSEKNKTVLEALHEKDKFWEEKEANTIFEKIKKEKECTVNNLEEKDFQQKPPVPFDLTTLQTEAYKCFNMRPKKTLELAQDLYTSTYISYPRTSSQQLPEGIGYVNILKQLKTLYPTQCEFLLKKKKLAPNNGKKTDPAHPAIYPTGTLPDYLEPDQAKVYDLIVKRFLATFGDEATRSTLKVTLEVKKENFLTKGSRTKIKGWHELYAPYVKLEEIELPKLEKNEKLKIQKIKNVQKETQPPKRYTQASIIKELEKRGLGTKATRASIVETLYDRNYVKGDSLEATDLGINIIEILEKYVEKIVDEQLTKHFEEDMDQIRGGKLKKDVVLKEAQKILKVILDDFKKKEKSIGESLKETFKDTRASLRRVGKCQNCEEGDLVIKKGKFGLFAACDKYPDCKVTFSLPSGAKITKDICEQCNHPMLKIFKKGKIPQNTCINPNCPSKKTELTGEGETCDKCGKGKMIVKKGIYGAFVACDQYPKCKNIKK